MSPDKNFLFISVVLAACSASTVNRMRTSFARNNKKSSLQYEKARICEAEDCREISEMYIEAMNKHADPCQNFYEFVCGGWAAKDPMPEYATMWNRFERMASTIEKYRKEMLETPSEVTDIRPIRQAKKFYQSCMNKDAREARGIETIASIIRSNGGWPMAMRLRDWRENAHSWQEVDGNFVGLGADYAFYDIKPSIERNGDLGSRRVLMRAPADANLPHFRDNYRDYRSMLIPIVEAFIRNRTDISDEQLETDIHDLFMFDRKLREARRTSNPINLEEMNLRELSSWWNHATDSSTTDPNAEIDWTKVIQCLFDFEGIKAQGNLHIKFEEEYYYSLRELWSFTRERTIGNVH
ncbi:neprilysin-1 [Diachasma alloeum]|uniref:neprilysin-1 n=1 Tax=Diachasma alloeum TaxID=454923 RepID=UPI0007384F21|nr:neprilysin-1 [Diachasma alloeum]